LKKNVERRFVSEGTGTWHCDWVITETTNAVNNREITECSQRGIEVPFCHGQPCPVFNRPDSGFGFVSIYIYIFKIQIEQRVELTSIVVMDRDNEYLDTRLGDKDPCILERFSQTVGW